MAAVKQENSVTIDIDHLFQKIENLEIALKASSDAYQCAQDQARKDRRKYQDEVDRICAAANLKQFQLQKKIKHCEDQLTSQLSPSKPKVSHHTQQTLPEDFPVIVTPVVVDAIDTTPSQKNISTQTIKNIDSVSSQTDEDQVVLANLKKISNLEISLSKMEHNENLLLAELKFQKENCLCLQDEVTMMSKKLAEVTYANNLYYVSLIEQNCSLPEDASLSYGGQAEDLHLSSNIMPSKEEQDAIYPFQKVQVDTKSSKKDQQATNQLSEDYNIATLFTLESKSLEKKANKTFTKQLAWITQMSKTVSKLETKYSIPLEKRKPRMFKRKKRTNHIIPKPFRTIFHRLAAPEPDPITVPEPYPVVDWANVRLKPALPNPEAFPVLSASKEPEFYQMQKGLYNSKESSKFSSLEKPFGTLPGYKTTEGVVQVPTNPVYGHIYCPVARKWLLHASLNPVGGRPGGRGCPGTRRGEKERGKKPHSLL